MKETIYEVKSEVGFNTEKDIAKKLNLDFINQNFKYGTIL